eukprot:TRINITY_DN65737_c5_g1_i2.p1 TRINITY_DN65737_c5_g1~~TRINITY_DN65737_c5_g1_i2.p1  ORF type:complete len:963 (+),score=480.60 TRINITY_DN65737_c5_g1_i2:105-2891(+)
MGGRSCQVSSSLQGECVASEDACEGVVVAEAERPCGSNARKTCCVKGECQGKWACLPGDRCAFFGGVQNGTCDGVFGRPTCCRHVASNFQAWCAAENAKGSEARSQRQRDLDLCRAFTLSERFAENDFEFCMPHHACSHVFKHARQFERMCTRHVKYRGANLAYLDNLEDFVQRYTQRCVDNEDARKAIALAKASRCKMYHNVDFKGHDLKLLKEVPTLRACCSACEANARCHAFSYIPEHNHCWLKKQGYAAGRQVMTAQVSRGYHVHSGTPPKESRRLHEQMLEQRNDESSAVQPSQQQSTTSGAGREGIRKTMAAVKRVMQQMETFSNQRSIAVQVSPFNTPVVRATVDIVAEWESGAQGVRLTGELTPSIQIGPAFLHLFVEAMLVGEMSSPDFDTVGDMVRAFTFHLMNKNRRQIDRQIAHEMELYAQHKKDDDPSSPIMQFRKHLFDQFETFQNTMNQDVRRWSRRYERHLRSLHLDSSQVCDDRNVQALQALSEISPKDVLDKYKTLLAQIQGYVDKWYPLVMDKQIESADEQKAAVERIHAAIQSNFTVHIDAVRKNYAVGIRPIMLLVLSKCKAGNADGSRTWATELTDKVRKIQTDMRALPDAVFSVATFDKHKKALAARIFEEISGDIQAALRARQKRLLADKNNRWRNAQIKYDLSVELRIGIGLRLPKLKRAGPGVAFGQDLKVSAFGGFRWSCSVKPYGTPVPDYIRRLPHRQQAAVAPDLVAPCESSRSAGALVAGRLPVLRTEVEAYVTKMDTAGKWNLRAEFKIPTTIPISVLVQQPRNAIALLLPRLKPKPLKPRRKKKVAAMMLQGLLSTAAANLPTIVEKLAGREVVEEVLHLGLEKYMVLRVNMDFVVSQQPSVTLNEVRFGYGFTVGLDGDVGKKLNIGVAASYDDLSTFILYPSNKEQYDGSGSR